MKETNKKPKTKAEQFFILMLLFGAMIGVLCLAGCGGGRSCEKPACDSINTETGSAFGCSIPGCGGCLTSGEGCNSACWPQSCKIVRAKDDSDGDSAKITACDTRYYGDGCLGCGQKEKSCYSGCIKMSGSEEINGFFYGSSDSDERLIGCVDGCGGCIGSYGIGGYSMYAVEELMGIG